MTEHSSEHPGEENAGTDAGAFSRVRALLGGFFAGQERVLDWGMVPLDAPPPNAGNLRAWVNEGLHAGLRYMEENLDKRADPRALFPWAKSAVLFLIRQPMPFGADTGAFRVASYALGEDYHLVARGFLDGAKTALSQAFSVRDARTEEKIPPSGEPGRELRFSGFCDTWPVFERDLAAEAGLGWRGKNATLLNRKHGSGFLIAGFFLDVAVPEKPEAARDFCGGCTACLDACPTDAFVAPGRLDANRCISYWTIEHKGAIPEELAARFGDRVFGCDTCQDVCPWNRKAARAAASPAPLLPDGWPRSAGDWLALLRKNGGFRSAFRGTPLPRAGRKALLRNLLIAMRNTGTKLTEEWRERLAAEEEDEAVRRML